LHRRLDRLVVKSGETTLCEGGGHRVD